MMRRAVTAGAAAAARRCAIARRTAPRVAAAIARQPCRGFAGVSLGGDKQAASAAKQRKEDAAQWSHDRVLGNRLNDIEGFLDALLLEREAEDPNFSPTRDEFDQLEAEAITRWAEANGYAMSLAEDLPEGSEDVLPGEVAEDGSTSELKFEQPFDNYHEYDAVFAATLPEEDEATSTDFMFNPHDTAFGVGGAGAAPTFSVESRALLDDILQGASADARQSVEALVHEVYGSNSPANYLSDMRRPQLPSDVIAPDHWAAPLLQQYLRVLDANPHYTPKQIETQLTQFARELGQDYYKDEPFVLPDGSILDDMPKDEDDDDEDDGYLN